MRVCVQDAKRQLTVVTDRSQGVSSIYNGSLEIMVTSNYLSFLSTCQNVFP